MTARQIITTLMALTMMTLAVGCEEPEVIIQTQTVEVDAHEVHYLDACNWRDVDGCNDADWQCDRDTFESQGDSQEDGICTMAQGTECTERMALNPTQDQCGLGLRCQAYDTDERGIFRCLPNDCIHSDECPEGQACSNNQCVAPGPGCGAL